MEILSSQPKISIKKIFKDNWSNYLATHRDSIPDYVIITIGKMLSCRDPEKLGYHKYACPEHPEEKGELKVFKVKQVLDAFFNPFLKINWYVYDSTDLEPEKLTVGYILRYAKRPPLAECRIYQYGEREGGWVTFTL